MASVTLRQHPAQHHLEPRLASHASRRVARKSSRKRSAERAARENANANNNGAFASCDADGWRTCADGGLPEGLRLRGDVVRRARSERHRREAWSIFSWSPPEPRAKTDSAGQGHLFNTHSVVKRDFCDACGKIIRSAARRCENCSYTCHLECEGLVQLDCNQSDRQTEETPTDSPCTVYSTSSVVKNAAKEDEEDNAKSLSEEQIKAKIEEYNSKVSENGMKLADDGSYTGFIKVHLKLRRPVTVLSPDGKGPGCSPAADGPERRTSFYMPSDTVKQIHVSSINTVSEVIQGLLKKFMVQDNPHKFALYKQTHRDGQDLFQKLAGSEQPLCLRLLAGPDLESLSFVLKENETGDVEWHAFSVPELQNFLTILNKEESERMKQVKMRYEAYKKKLLEALREVQSNPG
ncbi:ras association domain-containing protein 5 isoform X1 [Pygocentrus nattereri]|uniref:Ras association domain family member 5 n=1 Tax=Pygocentrus nattereri TaxID=42514 RepID=A0A3B4DR63_PYGNA|nr:ras association domain-containing protein 5 isoform X1 [Pygocentrus nattereri]